jgi:DNA-directed RNA polymerase subunit H (RpoH/RPB5)
MLGLTPIQAEFLYIMMDTGLKLEQHLLVQQDLQVLQERKEHKVLKEILVQQDQLAQPLQLQDLQVQLEPQDLQDLLELAAVEI